MLSQLLSNAADTLLSILFVLIVIAGIVILIILKIRTKNDVGFIPKFEQKHFDAANVVLRKQYLLPSEMGFYDKLTAAISKDFIVFPKVGVDQLMSTQKSRVLINAVMAEYVDFVIFDRKNMRPILAIDLCDHKAEIEGGMGKINENVQEALKAISLPIVMYHIEGEYNSEDLRIAIAEYLDPLTIIALRKQNKI